MIQTSSSLVWDVQLIPWALSSYVLLKCRAEYYSQWIILQTVLIG